MEIPVSFKDSLMNDPFKPACNNDEMSNSYYPDFENLENDIVSSSDPNSTCQSPIFQSQSDQFSNNTTHNFQGQQNISISGSLSIYSTFQGNQNICINLAPPYQNFQIQANPGINFPFQNEQDLGTRDIQGSSNIGACATNSLSNSQLPVNTSANFSSFKGFDRSSFIGQPGTCSLSSEIRTNAANLPPPNIILAKHKEKAPKPLKSGRPNYKKGPETARLKDKPGYNCNFEEDDFYQFTGKKKLDYYISIGEKYNNDFYERIHSEKDPLPKFGRDQKRNKNVCIHFLHNIFKDFPQWFQKNL